MSSRSRDQTQPTPRRISEPHHHHVQPRYPVPRRSNTDGVGLHKVHSRPEDYKNQPRPDKLFEYICFDGDDTPLERDEPDHSRGSDDAPLGRTETSDSSRTVESEDYDGDSEDELTLPTTYHHDVAHKHDYASWGTQTPNARIIKHDMYPNEEHGRLDLDCDRHRTSVHGHHQHRHDSHSSSSSTSRSRRDSPTGSEDSDALVARVAHHLRSHKDAYAKNHSASEIVNELLGEVVRKVADGGMKDGNVIREVLREVQNVL